MGCKRSQTLTSGSCAKCKPCKSLSYTAQDVMTAAESVLGQSSCWNSTSLSERDISIELPNTLNWKGLKDYQIQLSSCMPEFPFAELPPYLSCSNNAQALLCYDRQHCFPHDCSGMCFHNDITVGWEDGGTILKFITASIQGRWPALTQIYSVWMSAGASDTQ